MTLRSRLFLYTLFGAMGSLLLSFVAVFVVLASGAPRALVEVAYWPSRLCGTRPQDYMYPNLLGPIGVNIIGWTLLLDALALVHHSLAERKALPPR